MNFNEARIIRIETELQELKQQLRNSQLPELSEQERHDIQVIQQRIIALENQLIALYQQNAAAGENSYIPTDLTGSELI